MVNDGVKIEEEEFTSLTQKAQNLLIFKAVEGIRLEFDNMRKAQEKIKRNQLVLGLTQAGIYTLLGWIMYHQF